MVDIILQEEGIVHPSFHQRLVVRKAGDVLGEYVVCRHEVLVPGIFLLVAGPVQHIVERYLVPCCNIIVQVAPDHRQRTEIVTQ